jgi:hypothetical protein
VGTGGCGVLAGEVSAWWEMARECVTGNTK